MPIGKDLIEHITKDIPTLSLTHKTFYSQRGRLFRLRSDVEVVEGEGHTAIKQGEYEGKTFHYLLEDDMGQLWSLFSPSFSLLRALNEGGIEVGDLFRLKIKQIDTIKRNYVVTKISDGTIKPTPRY
jgi:integrase